MGGVIIKMKKENEKKRIEGKLEVQAFISQLIYAIEKGNATVNFQRERQVDKERDKKHTNRYTMLELFPDEDEIEVIKNELRKLTLDEYIETVKDSRFPKKTEMRVFGKKYFEKDVYIKTRVELLSVEHASGGSYIFVMSFHFSEIDFKEADFPHRKKQR
jgi:hypothetical protein